MRDKSQKRSSDHVRPIISAVRHKFAVGTYVSLIGGSEQTLFRVTRQLPDGGLGLQYRIKNDGENYERAAIEPLLTAARGTSQHDGH